MHAATWLPGDSVAAKIIVAASVITALGVIVKGILKVMRFAQRLEKVVINVERQLYPNGGASLRDAVNRIQERLDVQNVEHDSQAPDAPLTNNPRRHPPKDN